MIRRPEASSITTAMILGAGLGTRLASLGLDVPKVLVEVGGQPLLKTQVDYLRREGVERIVVNAFHRAEAIQSFVRQHSAIGTVRVITEPKLLGTAGAVRNALDIIGDQSFYVLYGDVLVDQPLHPIAYAHGRTGAAATVTVYETDHVEGKGTVTVDEQGWVTSFAEKQTTHPTRALVNAGLYALKPEFVADLPPGTESDFGLDVFPTALARGLPVFAFRLSVPVIDVGTPEGLARARAGASGPR